MTTDIDKLVSEIIEREGDYNNYPEDRGGPTRWGISEKTARLFNYAGSMTVLPKETAAQIYKALFWEDVGLDKLEKQSPEIAAKLFDMGINCGVDFAGKALQRALNVLNNQGKAWPDLKVDGRIGALTQMAVIAFLINRSTEGRNVLLFMLAALQSVRYITIAESDPSQEMFEYGWQTQRALYNAVV